MNEELQAFQENSMWDVASYPSNVKPIAYKWVYFLKMNYDDSLNRFKARLVTLENKHEYEVDYDETFALVSKIITIYNLLSIAASKLWCLYQIIVKNVFLHMI